MATKSSKKKFRRCDIVVATAEFVGRVTPPEILMGDLPTNPSSYNIPKGAQGLFHGRAEGAPDLHDVEFEVDGAFRRVEVHPGDIQHA